MKISIITVSYNSEKTIQRTIDSLKKQKCKDLEYLIIDGCSTDKTPQIIEENIEDLKKIGIKIKYINEKDTGIYNAMNKGIRLATGEIIGILNSDDYYLENTLENVEKNFINCDLLVGNMNIFYNNGKSKNIKSSLRLNKRMTICHPATFVKKEVYEKIGLFNEKFRIAADYDFVSRCYKSKMKIKLIDKVIVMMEGEGASNQKQNLKQILLENTRVRRDNKFGRINNLIYFTRDLISFILKML